MIDGELEIDELEPDKEPERDQLSGRSASQPADRVRVRRRALSARCRQRAAALTFTGNPSTWREQEARPTRRQDVAESNLLDAR